MNLTPPSSPVPSPDSGPWSSIQKVPGVQKPPIHGPRAGKSQGLVLSSLRPGVQTVIALPLSDQLGCHTCFHPEVQTRHGPRMTVFPQSLTCAWADLCQAQSAPWWDGRTSSCLHSHCWHRYASWLILAWLPWALCHQASTGAEKNCNFQRKQFSPPIHTHTRKPGQL